MDYIILDLEWNQSPYGRRGEHPRMPSEIIEIGAVRVSKDREMMDEFSELISPSLYKRFNRQIKDMFSYTENDLKDKGHPFKEVCERFLKWCGDDYIFCTWGQSDLFVLQQNMDFYKMPRLVFPLKFYDLQKIYAETLTADNKIQRLEKAVEELGISGQDMYHEAISDARYTAKVFTDERFPDPKDKYSIDIYRHPKSKEDMVRVFHDGCLEQISGEYASKIKAFEDKDIQNISCCKCGRKCAKTVKWFQATHTTEMAVGRCWQHGYMLSRIKFKDCGGSDNNLFAVKTTRKISRKKLAEVRERAKILREKKAAKRAAAL